MSRANKLTGLLCALAAFAGMTGVVRAQAVQRIAAIVNDQVISTYDLDARMQLVLFSTRLPDTPDVRQRIQSQVLRTLIDEKLEMQEAKRRNVSVSRRDMQRAVAAVERQNGIPKGQLSAMLERNDIPRSAMMDQMRANIAWSKLLARRIRPRITIGQDEIDEVLDRIKQHQGQTEYHLSEIVLSVDSPNDEARVHGTAQRIADQITKGASFAAIARQFSDSATAAVGGDMGWVHESELTPKVRAIVSKLSPGHVSQPIKTVTGYRLILLEDTRKVAQQQSAPAKVDLRQLFLPVKAGSSERAFDSQIGLARVLRSSATSCGDFVSLAKEADSPRKTDLGDMNVDSLAPAIRSVIGDLPAGKISEPVKMPDGVLLLMVCKRTGGGSTIKLPSRDQIADQLLQQRMSLMARRYLRDLRLAAVVDIRL